MAIVFHTVQRAFLCAPPPPPNTHFRHMSLLAAYSPPVEIEDEFAAAAHRNAAGQLRDATTRRLYDLVRWFKNARPAACRQVYDELTAQNSPPATPPPVPGSWLCFAGRDRGCKFGFCCMYSMWFDPEYKCVRECSHRCKVSRGGLPCCGPAIFENSVLARRFEEYMRRNPHRFAASLANRPRVVFSKRRNPQKRNPDQKGDSIPEAPKEVVSAHSNHSVHVVQKPLPKPKRARNKTGVRPVSRIRKCMGSTTFGKLGAKRSEKVPFVGSGMGGVVYRPQAKRHTTFDPPRTQPEA